MKTITIIAFICLSHFSLFGQSIDSLILGTWRWTEKGESTVILKRTDKFKYSAFSLSVNDNDTMYRSMYGSTCGNVPKRLKYKLRRGTWYFDSNDLFVIQYEDSPIKFEESFEERFEVIDATNKKITLKRIQDSETGLRVPLPSERDL